MDPQYPGGYGQGPQQSYGSPPSGGQYDFILGQGQKPKKSLLPGGGGRSGLLMRIIIVAVIAIVVFVAGIIVYNVATASSRAYPKKLLSLAQTQQELIRVTDMGVTSARAVETKNKATNAQLTVISDQTLLLATIKTYGLKPTAKTLALKANTQTDTTLGKAIADNTFDSVYTSVFDQILATYKQELQSAYSQAKTSKEKALLEQSFQHMELLSAQAD